MDFGVGERIGRPNDQHVETARLTRHGLQCGLDCVYNDPDLAIFACGRGSEVDFPWTPRVR